MNIVHHKQLESRAYCIVYTTNTKIFGYLQAYALSQYRLGTRFTSWGRLDVLLREVC